MIKLYSYRLALVSSVFFRSSSSYSSLNLLIIVCFFSGTGKTFTLHAISEIFSKHSCLRQVNAQVVIYKNDLVDAFKKYRVETYTVCRFLMLTFNIPDFYKYKALESQVNSSLSLNQFLLMFVNLLRTADYPHQRDGTKYFIIIDEYTIINKTFLIIVILLAKRLNVGVLICGDRDQLQTIRDSKHTRSKTSFDTISQLADHTYYLDTNERCSNTEYNDFIRLLSCYSSDRFIDNFAQALIYAALPTKINSTTQFTDLHLCATHFELARLQHKFVCEEKIPVSFYYIFLKKDSLQRYYDLILDENLRIEEIVGNRMPTYDQPARVMRRLPCGLFEPIVLRNYLESGNVPGKFVPYLTLKIGALYYYSVHREDSIVRLISIHWESDPDNTFGSDYLVVETITESNKSSQFIVTKCICNDVMFKLHQQYICGKDESNTAIPIPGPNIYNFPLYPINFITNHKVQGCTVLSKIDINLEKVNYRGMYVSLSRVRDPEQISNICFSSGTNISMFVTSIINVPELCELNFHDPRAILPMEVLQKRVIMDNYFIYNIKDYSYELLAVLSEFFSATSVERKREIRQWLVDRFGTTSEMTLLQKPALTDAKKVQEEYEKSESILTAIINKKNIIWSIAMLSVDPTDRACLIKCLIDICPDFILTGTAAVADRTTSGLVIDKLCNTENVCSSSESLKNYILRNARQDCFANSESELFLRQVNENVSLVARTKLQKRIYTMIENNELTEDSLVALIDKIEADPRYIDDDETSSRMRSKRTEEKNLKITANPIFVLNKRQKKH